MRSRKLSSILLAVVAAAFLPLRSDGDQATCCTATTSLATTVNNPVTGDESFFKLPSGPSNVMLLLDTSGSMDNFPACGDFAWDNGSAPATCKTPALATPAAPSGTTLVTVTGTCKPYNGGTVAAPDGTAASLQWMESVVPKDGYADPGQTNALLWDCPPWGNGGAACGTKVCSGDGCLFDKNAEYLYGAWNSGTSTANAVRLKDGTGAVLPKCAAVDTTGAVLTDCNGNVVMLGSDCTTCMSQHGYYFYKVSYATACRSDGTVRSTGNVTKGPVALFGGNFLNASPPKWVTSKWVVKNLAWMDPADSGDRAKLDQVRLGLTIISAAASKPQQAKLIVPLGPDKGNTYPPTQQKYRQSRQYLLSTLNYDKTVYTTDGAALLADKSNLLVDGNSITGGFFNPASGGTPLGSALFNVGQYFTSTGMYDTIFGNKACKNSSGTSVSCQVAAFNDTSAGDVNAAWVTNPGNTQCSTCWGCQNSSVIAITDGSPNSEIAFPSGTNGVVAWDDAAYNAAGNCGKATCAFCPAASNVNTSACTTCPCTCGGAACSVVSPCNCIEPVDGNAAVLPRIASWLHNHDLRADTLMSGKQALTVHTIAFNLQSQMDPRAYNILEATANMGGGTFKVAADSASLATALSQAVNMVIPKENSFSAASANSLQTVQTTASQAFLTRFKPNQTNVWEGHVFEAFLFDEFLNGCDPANAIQPKVSCGQATTKTVSTDFNGDGVCNGVFMIDLDCDEISEDPATGNFMKKGQNKPANLPWDAGQVLSYETFPGPYPPAGANAAYRSADEAAGNARNIFTWLGGKRVDLVNANAATLKPYMNIDTAWCTSFLATYGLSGGSDPTLECAKEIIYYVRGWDVLDQDSDGCAGPGKTNTTDKDGKACQRGAQGEERDRDRDGTLAHPTDPPFFWKLGDISHSSPAVAQAPIDEIRCDTGYEKQCVATLHSPMALPNQTAMPVDGSGNRVDTYEAYRQTWLKRQRLLLVGSNDGMLHAFDAGIVDLGKGLDITGSYQYTNGSGEELWAFVPPDLLPRLKDLLSAHQYMVDGSVMLRDVWVDGSAVSDGKNSPPAPSGADYKKQAPEFHTLAIFGRRAGGNAHTALDVTDPTKPTLLWNFPEGCSDDARYMGQSWSDFAPRPAPIVPVKLANASDPRKFEERWVVFINGGYDPALNLGRAVFMLDAWTGKTLWRFTDDDWKTTYGQTSSLFPVPGGVAPLDIGDPTRQMMDVDGFFDTATWGDMGGNLWVARMFNPGEIDTSTGRVKNWFAARAFEQQRKEDGSQSMVNRNEFFFYPSNAFDPSTRTLRTFLGAGNREQIMAQGASCGTDNLLACCQAGCTKVTATTLQNYGACSRTDTFACTGGALTHTASSTCGTGAAVCASAANYQQKVTLHWECPGAGAIGDSTGSVSCDGSGLCTVAPVGAKSINGTFNAQSHNRFYGVWTYGKDPKKLFDDVDPVKALAKAKVFDGNRFTDIAMPTTTCSGTKGGTCKLVQTTQAKVTYDPNMPQLTTTVCADGSATCVAMPEDAGWFYEYGDVCPLPKKSDGSSGCVTAPPWTDEKTGSGANVVLGCVAWGTFRPPGAATSSDPCSGELGTPSSYGYGTNYMSGTPNASCGCPNGGDAATACQRSITSPPSGAMVVVDVLGDGSGSGKKSGKIGYSVLNIDPGSVKNTSVGTRPTAGSSVYWLEVPRELHACRHTVPATPADTACR